jgi:hypothetical protein
VACSTAFQNSRLGDPLLKSLERDPRYAAFLKKMRLPV